MSRRLAAFIRHAEYQQLKDTPSALQPFALTAKGVEQSLTAAKAMCAFIQENNWRLQPTINTSSLLRAWQTAQLFSEQLKELSGEPLQLTNVDALAERSVGSAANLTIQQIEQVIDEDPRFEALPSNWKADSHFKLPMIGAESLLEAGQRVAAHVREEIMSLPAGDDDQLKLFFGHGAAFRHAAYALGVIEFEQVAKLSMYHASPVYLEHCADGQWRHVAGEWKVRAQHSEYTD